MATSLGVMKSLIGGSDSTSTKKGTPPSKLNSSDSAKAKDRITIMKAQDSGEFSDSKDASELESSRIAKQRISQEELKARVAKAQAQQAARNNK